VHIETAIPKPFDTGFEVGLDFMIEIKKADSEYFGDDFSSC